MAVSNIKVVHYYMIRDVLIADSKTKLNTWLETCLWLIAIFMTNSKPETVHSHVVRDAFIADNKHESLHYHMVGDTFTADTKS